MQKMATITSKRQLTIPVVIFQELGLEEGERVVVSEDNGKIVIQSGRDLVEELAGSVVAPKRFRGLTIEKMVELAKQEYLKNKK